IFSNVKATIDLSAFKEREKHRKQIEVRFPELLISDIPRKHSLRSSITVMGSYTDIMWFEEFLENGMATSQRVVRDQGRSPQSRHSDLSGPSAKQPERKEEGESCPICLDVMKKTEMKTLARCQHSFCEDCLKKAFSSKPICPVCGVVYGELEGTQPQNGTMEVSTSKAPLPGYPTYGSIIIRYQIPNSPEGRKVAKLLKRAFQQRLIFTIGRSSTTGRNNVVTWNDVHHKTSRTGGPTKSGILSALTSLNRERERLERPRTALLRTTGGVCGMWPGSTSGVTSTAFSSTRGSRLGVEEEALMLLLKDRLSN
ncbi:hypothetical protein Z043_115162, partial [Scleropages formosus]